MSGKEQETPDWYQAIKKSVPGVQIFPHVKLGEGFAKYALSADDYSVILVWPLRDDEDYDYAVKNLEAAKAYLREAEPGSFQEMVLLCDDCRTMNAEALKAHGIVCLDEPHLISFAIDYLSAENQDVRAGKLAFSEGDYDEAIQHLNCLDVKDHDAQYMLGIHVLQWLGSR